MLLGELLTFWVCASSSMCSDAMKEDRYPRTTQDSRQRQLVTLSQQFHTWHIWRRNLKQPFWFSSLEFERKIGKLFSSWHKQVLGCVPHAESLKSIANWVKCLSWKINKAALSNIHLVGAQITVTISACWAFWWGRAAEEVHWSSYVMMRSADSVCSISGRRHQRLSFCCQPESLSCTPLLSLNQIFLKVLVRPWVGPKWKRTKFDWKLFGVWRAT